MRVRILRPLLTIAAVAVALPAVDLEDIQVHGFISQGYIRTAGNAYYDPATVEGGSIDFREVALNILAVPEDHLRIGIQLLSQDMGRLYNNELVIDWASAVYTQPFHGWEADAKIGRIKTGHALYNDYRDLDISRTTVFLPECVYFNSWRRFYVAVDGVGTALRSPRTALGTVDLGLFYGRQQVAPDDPALAVYNADVASSELEREWGAQVTWRPLHGLTLKQSFLSIDNWENVFNPPDPALPDAMLRDFEPIYREFVTSLELVRGRFALAAEAIYWTSHGTTTYTAFDGGWTQKGIGGYVAATWEFTPRWKATLQVQGHNERTTDEVWGPDTDQTRAVGLAACCSLTDHWLIKGEFERVKGTYFLRSQDQPVPGVFASDYWTELALKTTFDF